MTVDNDSHTDAEGKVYTINYTADENGYRAQGDHLPVAPEVPAVAEVEVPAVAEVEAKSIVPAAAYAPLPYYRSAYAAAPFAYNYGQLAYPNHHFGYNYGYNFRTAGYPYIY